ncbi:DUF2269 family protein [Egicoccus halophilus]|uniref:DUF2269 family protein n=1 Tax=Egicoccus halophilus TaxID=1670830 RepID=A0A8J3AAQ4_9ACTN|nr:DUF2269 family protein [Egicoccus halophilus]GGI03347.1 hypothetical protein GCM10011354_03580 [Egicoccus halophilus]
MSLYSVLVFVHVVAAIAVVGGSLFGPLMGVALRRTETVGQLRAVTGYVEGAGTVAGAGALAVLASGLYLGFAGNWWGSGWIEVSLAMFALAGFLALGVADPSIKRLRTALVDAPDGPVTAAFDRLRREPRRTVAEGLLLGIDVTIVFLMTNKPGFVGALTAAAVGITAGAVFAVREHHHDTSALALPATEPETPATATG